MALGTLGALAGAGAALLIPYKDGTDFAAYLANDIGHYLADIALIGAGAYAGIRVGLCLSERNPRQDQADHLGDNLRGPTTGN